MNICAGGPRRVPPTPSDIPREGKHVWWRTLRSHLQPCAIRDISFWDRPKSRERSILGDMHLEAQRLASNHLYPGHSITFVDVPDHEIHVWNLMKKHQFHAFPACIWGHCHSDESPQWDE
jgi:hypothetical protein